MNCHCCTKALNEDMESLLEMRFPNLEKVATTLEGIAALEEQKRLFFCSTKCLAFHMLTVIQELVKFGAADPLAGVLALQLQLVIALETQEEVEKRKTIINAVLKAEGL